MGLELITYSISDIGKVITGKTPPASIKNAYSALDGVPFVTPKDMDGRRWIENTERYLTSDGVAAVKRNLVPAMSVAVSCIGSDMGKVVLLKKESITNQQINSVVIDVKRFNPKYIYYVLSTKQQYFKDVAGGSATPILNKTDFGKITFQAPSKYYQDLIVEYLDCLDSKHELNRQLNQTLEQMAQALFKSWFVDFDPVVDNALDVGFFELDLAFPDDLLRRAAARRAVREQRDFRPLPDAIRQLFPAAFEECAEPSLGLAGWMPQGWNAESLENVTSLIIDHRGKTPKKLGGDWSERGHPAISAKNIKNGRLVRHDAIRYVDSDLYTRWMKDPLLAGDILMTSEAPLGELLYLVNSYDYLLSQRLYGIRADKNFISGCYLYFWLQTNSARADIDGRATGTTVVGIRQSELKQIKVMVPQKIVLDEFSNLATNYLEKVESNEKQSIELERIRDELLPQLISGKLRLDKIEADLAKEEVA